MRRLSFFFIFTVILWSPLWSQETFTDSLKNALETAAKEERTTILIQLSKSTPNREEALKYAQDALNASASLEPEVLALNQIAWGFKNIFQFDSAIVYAKMALSKAESLKDALVTSDVYNTYGSIYNNRNEFDSAIYYHQLALEKRIEANDPASQAASMNNLSIIYQRKAEFAKAAELINQSIKIYEELGMERSAADSYLNKGNLYTNKGDLDSAYRSFQNSLRVYEKLGLNVMMTYSLINMATVAKELENWADTEAGFRRSYEILIQADKNPQLLAYAFNGLGVVQNDYYHHLDSAIYYYSLGAENAKLAQSNYLLSISHNNLGSIYAEKGEFAKAIEYLGSARDLKTAMGELSGLSSVYVSLGDAFERAGDRVKAEKNYLEGLKIAEEINDLSDRQKAYNGLYNFYKSGGRYKDALDNLEKMNIVKDSILNKEHLATVADLNIGYQTEKKEQQIELQQAELAAQEVRLQRNQIFVLALIIIVLLVVIVFMLWKNRTEKTYALERQEARLKLREAEINAVINSQEKERNRFARDLHDGFGQLISVLKLNLSNLKEVSSKDVDKRVEVFKTGEAVIEEMYDELRNICFDLMPRTLVKQGLTEALREFGLRINETQKLICEVLVFDEGKRFSDLVEISLFRISQEWINNILKYSKASRITLQLTADADEITLTIEDDGPGFDKNLLFESQGNGWKNIQTRVNQVGGELDLDTVESRQGNTLVVNVSFLGIAKEVRPINDLLDSMEKE